MRRLVQDFAGCTYLIVGKSDVTAHFNRDLMSSAGPFNMSLQQTVWNQISLGAVWSGSILFVCMAKLILDRSVKTCSRRLQKATFQDTLFVAGDGLKRTVIFTSINHNFVSLNILKTQGACLHLFYGFTMAFFCKLVYINRTMINKVIQYTTKVDLHFKWNTVLLHESNFTLRVCMGIEIAKP